MLTPEQQATYQRNGYLVLPHFKSPDTTTAIPLEVEAGALVVFHGLLPHYSAPNRSSASRHAYTLHVTDATAHYSPANWIQRGSELPVHGF